jgi:hypothetical protein
MARVGRLLAVCVIILISVIAATTVTIARTNSAENGGFFIRPYYEYLNAPVTGCTAPCLTVDTQTTVPNPSSGTAALDGSAVGTTATLTTIQPNDVIYLMASIGCGGFACPARPTPSGGGLTWVARSSATQPNNNIVYTWYAISTGTLTSAAITVTPAPTFYNLIAFGISGANTANPFDPNVPACNSGAACNSGNGASPKTASSTITTTNRNDFIIGALVTSQLCFSGTCLSVTKGAAFTQIQQSTFSIEVGASAEYETVTSTQSGLSVSYSITSAGGFGNIYWSIVADAVVAAKGSFSLPAGSSMYLWSPQFASSTAIPAGALSLQLFADLPAPALD